MAEGAASPGLSSEAAGPPASPQRGSRGPASAGPRGPLCLGLMGHSPRGTRTGGRLNAGRSAAGQRGEWPPRGKVNKGALAAGRLLGAHLAGHPGAAMFPSASLASPEHFMQLRALA